MNARESQSFLLFLAIFPSSEALLNGFNRAALGPHKLPSQIPAPMSLDNRSCDIPTSHNRVLLPSPSALPMRLDRVGRTGALLLVFPDLFLGAVPSPSLLDMNCGVVFFPLSLELFPALFASVHFLDVLS